MSEKIFNFKSETIKSFLTNTREMDGKIKIYDLNFNL